MSSKKRTFYGQADRNRWPPSPPPPLRSAFRHIFVVRLTSDIDYMCSETDFTPEKKTFSYNYYNLQFLQYCCSVTKWLYSGVAEALKGTKMQFWNTLTNRWSVFWISKKKNINAKMGPDFHICLRSRSGLWGLTIPLPPYGQPDLKKHCFMTSLTRWAN